MEEQERQKRLAELQKATRERLRAGCAKVSRLEEPVGSLSDLEKRIADEYARYGGRPPELSDE